MELNWKKLEAKLKKELDENRYQHTLGVMYTATCLAMRYGVDINKARLAGLLHDCAKCIPNKKYVPLCRKAGLEVTPFEEENAFLLHSKYGAYLAEQEYQVFDPDVRSAIRWHTTGRENMTLLEEIVFVADYIEPNRTKAPRLNRLRHLAFLNLQRCTLEILSDTISYLGSNPKSMDQTTLKAYRYYKDRYGDLEIEDEDE